MSKVMGKSKVRDISGISVVSFGNQMVYREEIIDFVQSIPGFQKCDEEDVETWMACDAEDCGFQMLNDDEIVTSVQEESDPVDDETDEDDDITTKVARVHQMLTSFCVRDSHRVVGITIRVLSYSTTASQENRRPCSEKTKVYNGTAKNK
ncbi:uncharacterized protein TNCV_4692891 [Trichonephila clavipes]|nr:uncharacterized protein TNCV_4692891 [Trichonephila clavipes]